MQKVMIELEPEQIDSIVIGEIQNSLDGLEEDLQKAKASNESGYLGVFDNNPIEDSKQIADYIKAMKLVLSYYSGESTCF